MKGLDVYVDKKEDDYKIEKAKLDQDLAERIAKGRLALKEAEFDAESNVPSDADVIPGDAEDQSSKPKSLMGSYQAEAKRRLDELRAGLEGEHLERFNSSMELYDQDSALRIRRTQRTRDIDAARASLERTEQLYIEMAGDPTSDIDQLVDDWLDNVGVSVGSGAWGKLEGQQIFDATAKQMKAVHAAAVLKAQVRAETDRIMSYEIEPHQRMKLARNLEDPELSKRVSEEVLHASNVEAALQKEADQERFDEAELAIKFENKSLDDIDIDSFSARQQISLRTMMAGKAPKDAKGSARNAPPGTATDETIWVGLWHQAGNDPELFKKTELTHLRPYLNRADYNELVKIQKDMRAGKEVKIPMTRSGAWDARPLIKQTWPEDDEMQDWALYRLQEMALAKMEKTGEKPSQMDLRDMTIDVLKTEKVDRGFGYTITDALFPKYRPRLIELDSKEANRIAATPIADQEEIWIEMAGKSLRNRGVVDPSPMDVQAEIAGIFDELGILEESTARRPKR